MGREAVFAIWLIEARIANVSSAITGGSDGFAALGLDAAGLADISAYPLKARP